MSNAYDATLRERVVVAYEAGRGTYHELAEIFGLGSRTVERWVARWRATGSAAALPNGGGWRSPIDVAVLHAVITDAPDAICAELCWEYNRRVPRAQQTTPSSLWRAMRRAGYVLKKNGPGRVRSTGPRSKRNAPDS
jgi:transposase